MKATYFSPSLATRGSIVQVTLGSKDNGIAETPVRKLGAGTSLSFGL